MPTWTILKMLKDGKIHEYKKMVARRGKDTKIVDEFVLAYNKYVELRKLYDMKKHELNVISRNITNQKNNTELIKLAKRLKEELVRIKEKLNQSEKLYIDISYKLPNIILPGVPDGEGEDDNVPIEYWDEPMVWSGYLDKFFEITEGFNVKYKEIDWKPIGHADMVEHVLKKGDTLQAGKIAGSRFFYLFDDLVWLDFAISMFAMDFLAGKGYKLVLPPYMVREIVIKAALDYETFLDMIYKIDGEDLYLIGTAEHPLLALYIGRILEEDEIPLKLAGWSACFRKEAGAHGKDTKGIFRVHQFHKVEQFIFCPRDLDLSEKLFIEMVNNTKQICELLGLPYRVVNMCAGELADHAARKYDVEVWFPAQGKYREIASISNCLDWQSYRGNICYALRATGKLEYPYTLNGTGIPTSRAICAILENYQEEDGIVVIPKILRKYLEPFENAPNEIIEPVKEKYS